MPPEIRKLLLDMRESAGAIIEFVTGKAAADLGTDKLLRSGIYFQFVVIGEAMSQIRHSDPAVADRISESWRIVGFRNQIIHGYAKIDDEITWRIIQEKLPILVAELDELLHI